MRMNGGIAPALAAALVATLGFGAVATAEELKLSHFIPTTHVMHSEFMQPWAEALAKQTGGKVTVQIYPASQLGGQPPGQYKQVVNGGADIAFGIQGYTSSVFPRTGVLELPTLTTTPSDATNKLWAMYEPFLQSEYADTKVLALWVHDPSVIMTRNKAVRSAADLKGLKIRTPSAVQSATIEALGAVPVNMPITKVYNALERGVVDGVMGPISIVSGFRLNEVAKFFTVGAPIGYSPFFLAMNKASYERLPPEARQVVDRTSGQALSLKGAEIYDAEGRQVLKQLRGDSSATVIELTAAEQEQWRQALTPVVEAWAAEQTKAGHPARDILSLLRK